MEEDQTNILPIQHFDVEIGHVGNVELVINHMRIPLDHHVVLELISTLQAASQRFSALAGKHRIKLIP